MVNFVQINLNHAIAPTTEVGNRRNCVYLVQEQHLGSIRNKRNFFAAPNDTISPTRAGIYISSATTFTFLPLSRFTGRDVSAGLLESRDLSVPTIIASVYMDGTIPHVPTLLLDLINYCKTERIPLLFAADTNAWSSMWGSPEDNKRGEMLEELVIDECLEIFNIGNAHTFRRHLGGRLAEKIIDVTFGLGVIDSVTNWKVSTNGRTGLPSPTRLGATTWIAQTFGAKLDWRRR
jgi:hypothetical protein